MQSDRNIWWLLAAEVPHENYDILKWYFDRTGIPNIIELQQAGQKLDVPGYGAYDIEWHLGGDLKTLKCMLGCKGGANTLFPCIYCCHPKMISDIDIKQDKVKEKATKCKLKRKVQQGLTRKKQAIEKDVASHSKTKMQWFNGITSCDQSAAPSRHKEDPHWKPILDIPLSQVHVCTLHARLRVLDKLLKLHINYVWNMEPADRRDECIRAVERILSGIGLHAGAVKLTKDKKGFSVTQDNPNKVSMGGVKSRHLLANHTASSSHTDFELWKPICDVTTYRGNEASVGLERAGVWQATDNMLKLLERPMLAQEEVEALKQAINTFTESMVVAWGETHITHYMVNNIYTSLSI